MRGRVCANVIKLYFKYCYFFTCRIYSARKINTMNNQTGFLRRNYYYAILILILAFGVFIRCYNLDYKVVAGDEAHTIIFTSGMFKTDFARDVADRVTTIEHFRSYLFYNPDTTYVDTLKSLAQDEPQHTPLYYLLSRIWIKTFGSTISAARGFSVFISFFMFPLVFWLSMELFEYRKTAWLAVAMAAVSPLLLIFSQEIRMYSLWTVTFLLSSALLLRALKTNRFLWWIFYALSLSAGLYTFPIFIFIIAAHFSYIVYLIIKGQSQLKLGSGNAVMRYAISTALGVISLTPWIFIIYKNYDTATKNLRWLYYKENMAFIVKSWAFNFTSTFADFGFVPKLKSPPVSMYPESIQFLPSWFQFLLDSYPGLSPVFYVIKILISILILYSIYYLYARRSTRKNSILLLFLIAVPFTILAVPDLLGYGIRSTIYSIRYSIPVLISVLIVVAYALSYGMDNEKALIAHFWRFITAVILLLGITTSIVAVNSRGWWYRDYLDNFREVAAIINKEENALVVTPLGGQVLTLPHYLNSGVRMYAMVDKGKLYIGKDERNVYLYDPYYRINLGHDSSIGGMRAEVLDKDMGLWRLSRLPQ